MKVIDIRSRLQRKPESPAPQLASVDPDVWIVIYPVACVLAILLVMYLEAA